MGQGLHFLDRFIRPAEPGAAHVRRFCRQLSPAQSPLRVAAQSWRGTRAGMCFHNVSALLERHGGAIAYGWLIWEWADTYIEAEHHAAWCRDGELVEVTPRDPHHPEVVFLADPHTPFDFQGRRRRDNVRMALRSDGVVREYLALAAAAVALEEEATQGDEIVFTPAQTGRMEEIAWRKKLAEAALVRWSLAQQGRNSRCSCGSGRKHKRCCLPRADQAARAVSRA